MGHDTDARPSKPGFPRGRWPGSATRGWLLLGAVLACLLVLAGVDRGLKEAPHGGFCPADASMVAFTAQWPAFWSHAEATDVGRAAAEPLGKLTHEASLPVLRSTGIRPTPARWRLWLGPTVLAGWRGDGTWGVCVRPGILARIAHTANCLVTGQLGSRRIYRLARRPGVAAKAQIYYAWREGFLLVSPSRDYLLAALEASPRPRRKDGATVVTLAWRRKVPMQLTVKASDGLPLRATVDVSVSATPTALRLANAWPDAPTLSLSAASWEHARALAAALAAPLPPTVVEQCLPLALGICGFDRLKDDWADGVGACAVALSPGAVWPEATVALERLHPESDGRHPWLAAIPPDERLPVAWADDTLGVMAPILGKPWTLCLDEEPGAKAWLATTTEEAMARLRGRMTLREGPVADYALTLRWPEAGKVAATVLRTLIQSELIPGWGGKDLDSVLKDLESISQYLGTADLTGTVEGGQVVFEGLLAKQEVVNP